MGPWEAPELRLWSTWESAKARACHRIAVRPGGSHLGRRTDHVAARHHQRVVVLKRNRAGGRSQARLLRTGSPGFVVDRYLRSLAVMQRVRSQEHLSGPEGLLGDTGHSRPFGCQHSDQGEPWSSHQRPGMADTVLAAGIVLGEPGSARHMKAYYRVAAGEGATEPGSSAERHSQVGRHSHLEAGRNRWKHHCNRRSQFLGIWGPSYHTVPGGPAAAQSLLQHCRMVQNTAETSASPSFCTGLRRCCCAAQSVAAFLGPTGQSLP